MTEPTEALSLNEAIQLVQRMRQQIARVVVGQQQVIDQVLIAMLASGHVLVEGVPGLGKTLLVKSLAKCFQGQFGRIQFTPDLMPSDITGSELLQDDPETRERKFMFTKGPIFSNLVLADEINRTPPKTQAALLEAMQEKQVTIGTVTHKLPAPFIVMATQNPVEQEGTYPLPEAQLDRFMFKMSVGYPDRADEDEILARRINRGKDAVDVDVITNPERVIAMQQACEDIYVDPALRMYMVEIVSRTREDPRYLVGSSPRGSQALLKTSRAAAALRGRDFVTPDDIKTVSELALAHRIILKPEHQIKGL
ncbi:MAG TPA: hypothetical protein DCS92_01540, partial [Gammaproteobacteria bacterium]|nr:hypothetical protein [Gammaproteobacteria bacterium]